MKKLTAVQRRRLRIKKKLRMANHSLPRLNVYISNYNIFCQIIDDRLQHTLVSANTLKFKSKNHRNVVAAQKIGNMIAEKALEKNIKQVVFDRNFFRYHGKIKALVETARKEGLKI